MATADRPGWRTSSFSNNGATCVEVDPGAAWRTSSFTNNGDSCVEVELGPESVRIRDTKDRGTGPILVLDPAAWAALRAAAGTLAPGRTGGLRVATDRRETVHAGVPRTTTWHVATGAHELHFTDAERAAFAAGVHAGEFSFVAA